MEEREKQNENVCYRYRSWMLGHLARDSTASRRGSTAKCKASTHSPKPQEQRCHRPVNRTRKKEKKEWEEKGKRTFDLLHFCVLFSLLPFGSLLLLFFFSLPFLSCFFSSHCLFFSPLLLLHRFWFTSALLLHFFFSSLRFPSPSLFFPSASFLLLLAFLSYFDSWLPDWLPRCDVRRK